MIDRKKEVQRIIYFIQDYFKKNNLCKNLYINL